MMHQHADDDMKTPARRRPHEAFFERYGDLVLPAASGVLLLAGFICDVVGVVPHWLVLLLYAGAYLAGGWKLAISSIKSILRLRFDIDFLMLVAGIGAAVVGHYAEGALLFFLFSLGHALEHYAMGRARKAIQALGSITPKTALRIDDDGEHIVPVEELAVNDLVRVRPNSRLPVDGRIEDGTSSIDQSAITGESIPVDRGPGARVFAGSVNGDSALAVRVDRLASDTTMARMIKMVEEAKSKQGVSQRVAQKFTRIYVPVIIIGTLLLILLPPLSGTLTWPDAFLRGMTVLVAASPCALAISTPSAVLAGIGQAARNGVLIKGGLYLEKLGAVRAVAMDKTGTLTSGRPEVTDLITIRANDESELLRAVGSVEVQSSHPLAKAISRTVKARSIEIPTASDMQTLAGVGVEATVEGELVSVGGLSLLEGTSVDGAEEATDAINTLTEQARTTMVVLRNGAVLGVIGLADRPRANAPAMVQRLHALGVRLVVMLTGDNKQVARTIGEQVGVDRIEAELMPEDKIRIVNELCAGNQSVAMVGDGVNDAPCTRSCDGGRRDGCRGDRRRTRDSGCGVDGGRPFQAAVRNRPQQEGTSHDPAEPCHRARRDRGPRTRRCTRARPDLAGGRLSRRVDRGGRAQRPAPLGLSGSHRVRRLLILVALAVLFPSCANTSKLERHEFVELVMASPARLVLYAPDEATARRAARATYDRMHDVDRALSDWNENSQLRQLVAAAPEPMPANELLRNAVIQATDYSRATEGAFDPTLGPLVTLWREARTSGELPSPERIETARTLVGIDFVELTPDAIRITQPGASLDLGGIGKGIALDEAGEVLRTHRIHMHLIDLDGEIQVGAAPPRRHAWIIEIQPHGDAERLELDLLEQSVSTSGDINQFVEIGGTRYSHVLDPKSGLGLGTRIQVTVVAASGAAADALATAGCVLGPERFTRLLEENYPDASALVTTLLDGKTILTRIGKLPVRAPDVP